MAFVTVEDLYGAVECVCFPKVYDKMRSFLEADKVVSLTGKINIDEEKVISWIKNGAQPTDTVRSLLSKKGIMKKIHEERTAKG